MSLIAAIDSKHFIDIGLMYQEVIAFAQIPLPPADSNLICYGGYR
jgi:hypothetical protein